jgi:hypothetical protein
VHQRPQLGDQVKGLLRKALIQQEGGDGERGLLRHVYPVTPALEHAQELGLAGVAEVPQVQPFPARLSRHVWRQRGERRLSQVPAGRETAVRHLKGDPGRSVRDRGAAPDLNVAFGHPGQHVPPPLCLLQGPLTVRRVTRLSSLGHGPLQLANRVDRGYLTVMLVGHNSLQVGSVLAAELGLAHAGLTPYTRPLSSPSSGGAAL